MPASCDWSRRRNARRPRCRDSPIAGRSASLRSTVAIASAAWWFSGDPIRAVAVLVVATPCPLILAVPVALVAGPLARGALRRTDQGREAARSDGAHQDADPRQDRHPDRRPPADRVDRRTRAADGGGRICASRLRSTRRPSILLHRRSWPRRKDEGLSLPVPTEVAEIPGEGVVGAVDGHQVIVGGDSFVAKRVGRSPGDASGPGGRIGPRGGCSGWSSGRTSRHGRSAARRRWRHAAGPAAEGHRQDPSRHRRPLRGCCARHGRSWASTAFGRI